MSTRLRISLIVASGILANPFTPRRSRFACSSCPSAPHSPHLLERALARGEALRPMLGDSPEWKVDMAELYLQNGERVKASAMLREAGAQLDILRKTPARVRLRGRIVELEGRASLAENRSSGFSSTDDD